MKRVCLVTASPLVVTSFLAPLLRALAVRYEITLAVNADEGFPLPSSIPARLHSIPIERRIAPATDLLALWRLVRLFRSRGFKAVHSIGPKAGLLAMTAAWLTRVPVRMHTFTGQAWVTRSGPVRALLKTLDWWIARAATHVLADSHSQREFLVAEGVVHASRCEVLAAGSVSGVDTHRFRPDPSAREAVRRELSLDAATILLLFAGRMNRDKGVLDLAAAFAGLYEELLPIALVFVGPDEQNLRPALLERAGVAARAIRFVDYTVTPERYLAAADVLCIPSYREGFGSVVIEAAAAGIPAVGSRIYGLIDAIVDGKTGLLHAPRDIDDLAEKLRAVVTAPELRRSLGACAYARAIRDFSQDVVSEALLRFYERTLGVVDAIVTKHAGSDPRT